MVQKESQQDGAIGILPVAAAIRKFPLGSLPPAIAMTKLRLPFRSFRRRLSK